MSDINVDLRALGFTEVQKAKGIAEYRLDCNGLKVLLSEDHSKPVVTYMALYRVGSRFEAVGNTGATHLLEHMMFKGTQKHNPQDGTGVFETLKPLGNMVNATTWFDRTNYFACVPAEHLAVCIELEADRMRNLRLREDDRITEMPVVRQELDIARNNPDRVMLNEMFAVAFREHPYHAPTIGWRSDVEGVPLARLKEFYDTYYWPNNCTVLVRGDFNTVEALTQIAQQYGSIPSSPNPIPTVYTVEPPQEGERRFEIDRSSDLERVWLAYHIPQASHPDTYALEAISALLGDSGKTNSRLYKRMVDSGLCSEISLYNFSLRDPALFLLHATVSPHSSLAEVEKAFYDELDRLASQPISAEELFLIKESNRKGTIIGALDPFRGWVGLVADGEASVDWRWMFEFNDNFKQLTPETIQSVAGRYFSKRNRTVGHFVRPAEQPAAGQQAAKLVSETMLVTSTTNQKDAVSERVQTRSAQSEPVLKKVLPNGMKVVVQSNPGSGAVSISGKIRAGNCFGGDISLIPELTAFHLTRGSRKYSKSQIADLLEAMGPSASSLRFTVDNFGVTFGGSVVREDLASFVGIIADSIRHPLFLDDELERAKEQFRSFLTANESDSARVADKTLAQALYTPKSPYWSKTYANLRLDVDKITPDLLRRFHAEYYSPNGCTIAVVGDIDSDRAFALVESVFADWQGPAPKAIDTSKGLRKLTRKRVDVHRPNKSSTDIFIGVPSPVKRTAEDFCAARIADLILGGDTISSRLGQVIRVQHGLTYGIYSYFDDTSFGNAPWMISLSVDPANIDRALALVDETVNKFLVEGVTDREMADLTAQASAAFLVGQRTDLAVAASLTAFTFLDIDVDEMVNYPQRIKAVTKEQVNQALRRYLRLDRAVTVVCGTF